MFLSCCSPASSKVMSSLPHASETPGLRNSLDERTPMCFQLGRSNLLVSTDERTLASTCPPTIALPLSLAAGRRTGAIATTTMGASAAHAVGAACIVALFSVPCELGHLAAAPTWDNEAERSRQRGGSYEASRPHSHRTCPSREDVMRRSNVKLTPIAVALQVASLLVIASGLAWIVIADMRRSEPVARVELSAQPKAGNLQR
jgi:hypothetical protein